ncbi:MAG: two-component system, chemotaxis family, CheB/CheR fusion protein [Actinomycetota bacterium]|nr:two-component system, chemotaxis family, CheB/CheR fusion protein [Actinomycetota bacterium]
MAFNETDVETVEPGIDGPEPALDELIEYIRQVRGFDFGGYKRPSLTRRIQKRMSAVGADDFPSYQTLLEAQPDEFAQLFDTVLINVTSFRRDGAAWDHLASTVIPRLLEGRSGDGPIRVWSAGCASGEEVYSLAILLCEALGEAQFRDRVKVYGTDADDDALTQARQGRYRLLPTTESLGERLVGKYFEHDKSAHGKSENGKSENRDVVFRKDLRRAVIFGRHDLLRDPPISRVDLLVCRNTLMYFNAETQRRILGHFHFALNDGGFLFLGKSEALVTRTNLFALEDAQHHVFEKRPGRRSDRGPRSRSAVLGGLPLTDLLDDAFENSPAAQLVVNREGTLAMANRHARSMFAIGLGDVGRPFKDLELSYRPIELRSRIEQVLGDRRPLTIGDVVYEMPGGVVDCLEIRILPIASDHTAGVSLTFTQVGRHKLLREELERSKLELERAYEELQSTVEELETTNEELHSTNEELETMNEELQSTNEELETINGEIRQRTADLDEANAFLHAILTSLGSGVAVLTRDLSVRAWNDHAEDLWGLRADEVRGQHFLNLDIGLPLDELHQAIRRCLAGQSRSEQTVVAAVNRRGRAVDCEVSITPLLDGAGGVDGVIVRMDARADRG